MAISVSADTGALLSLDEASAKAGIDCPVFHRISTRAVPVGDRFDYWRSHFVASRIEKPRTPRVRDFVGEMLTSTPIRGVVFSDLRGDPITCHFGQHGSGIVLLGCVRAGTVNIRHGKEQAVSVTPRSGLVMFDCDRPFTTFSQRYAMTYLALPRALVEEALDDDPVASDSAVRVLHTAPLTGSFLHHLAAMARHGPSRDSTSAVNAVHTATALGVSLLAGLRPRWPSQPLLDDALLTSAKHQLRLRAGDPELTAARIARSLGCSRAHLYRLFERQGETVTGHLREFRLQRARSLLAARPHESIGMIALHCGYTDLSAFGKAFRRRYGLTPTDFRYQISGSPASDLRPWNASPL